MPVIQNEDATLEEVVLKYRVKEAVALGHAERLLKLVQRRRAKKWSPQKQQKMLRRLAQAKEAGERAVEERQKVEALVKSRQQSAQTVGFVDAAIEKKRRESKEEEEK